MRNKNLSKKEKIIRLPISKFIDTKFRDYAVYVLESRGIPSFYDALTPVQRFILKNTPSSFIKTLSVVGKSYEDGYHHGNVSIEKAIAKLARPFGNTLQMLEGYGFFGSEVSPTPAAPRYTSVKLSRHANDILNKYNYLTTRDDDGHYHPFWMDVPVGLSNSVVGIAVGYKTTILPRKLEHIREFLEGRRKNVKPYFNGFSGKISRYKDLDRAWLISSVISVEDKKIQIEDVPPILKYVAVLKKLDNIIERFENIRIVNNSNNKVDIGIIYSGKSQDEWEKLQRYVEKSFSIIVTENPVFIKDNQVLVYNSIEEYLEDYKWQVKRLHFFNTQYEKNKLKFDLDFNHAKKLFIEFILQKRRTNKEIDVFLKEYNKEIRERLERLTARKFTSDELSLTRKEITNLTNLLKLKTTELVLAKKDFENNLDPTLQKSIASKKININLFETDDIEESVDGIVIWDGDDIIDNNEKVLDSEE